MAPPMTEPMHSGNDREHEIGHALRAAAAHDAHEDSGGHEDQNHGDDVFIPDPTAHKRQLLVKTQLPVLQAGHQQRRQKGHHDGDVVKPHGYLQHTLENDSQAQIQHQEHADG